VTASNTPLLRVTGMCPYVGIHAPHFAKVRRRPHGVDFHQTDVGIRIKQPGINVLPAAINLLDVFGELYILAQRFDLAFFNQDRAVFDHVSFDRMNRAADERNRALLGRRRDFRIGASERDECHEQDGAADDVFHGDGSVRRVQ
jgi:hypothetical protein